MLGGTLFAGGMLLVTVVGLRKQWERFGQRPESDSWLDQLKRDTYEPLPGWMGLFARLAVPMLAIGVVLICAGILLRGVL